LRFCFSRVIHMHCDVPCTPLGSSPRTCVLSVMGTFVKSPVQIIFGQAFGTQISDAFNVCAPSYDLAIPVAVAVLHLGQENPGQRGSQQPPRVCSPTPQLALVGQTMKACRCRPFCSKQSSHREYFSIYYRDGCSFFGALAGLVPGKVLALTAWKLHIGNRKEKCSLSE